MLNPPATPLPRAPLPAMTADPDHMSSPVRACDACEPPESGVVKRLFQLHHTMMRVGDQMARGVGLTSSRWMLVCGIGRCEVPPTVSELSEELRISPQNIARMVASMHRDGLVERFHDPEGGRAARLRLTETGERARQTTFELRDRFLGPFLEGFDPERRAGLEHDLDDLIENLTRFEHGLGGGDA